mmetsp:Transcript_494/g.1145  ORF Transcript_494/g.1145 Transcript_494/m.1145 type:complete len:503 (-) Transcript_494:139-1647(-)
MGGPFVQRTEEQRSKVPTAVDAFVAVASGVTAAVSVSPFLMCVDKAVVAAAAGTAPGGSLFRAIFANAAEFVKKPRVAFSAPALWMVAGVYGATYGAANLSDVAAERSQAEPSVAAVGKFSATTTANMAGSVLKDAAFARLFGAYAAASGAPPIVPMASYALFAVRDCLTISGAFFVPATLSAGLSASGAVKDDATAAALSQLVSPPLMQVVCTPLHLMALNLVNAPGATLETRLASLAHQGPAALLARSMRMLPAYGIGGLLNGTLTKRGRNAAAAYYDCAGTDGASVGITAEEQQLRDKQRQQQLVGDGNIALRLASLGGMRARVTAEVEAGTDVDDLFGDDGGEHILHKLTAAIYGGMHPVMLAPAQSDGASWTFHWDRLIQSTVSAQLNEMGGDTIGGCVVVGGDAEVDAAVDAFVKRVDTDGDGFLSVSELETALAKERAAGVGWAAKAQRYVGRAQLQAAGVLPKGAGSEADAEVRISVEDVNALLRNRLKDRSDL